MIANVRCLQNINKQNTIFYLLCTCHLALYHPKEDRYRRDAPSEIEPKQAL